MLYLENCITFWNIMKYCLKINLDLGKNNSTSNALMEITESIDSGNFGCGIFIDLKKAYDTVNHEILLKN